MLTLQPGEQVIFPAPFVPTDHHPLVVTNKRVTRFAPMGAFPIGEFEIAQLDFVGRMSERPYVGVAVLIAAVGLILLIVGAWKLLPPILHAGAKAEGAAEMTDDGRLIQGKDAEDDYPFFDKELQAKSKQVAADRLKQLSQIKPGIPALTHDVIWGLVFVVLGFIPLALAGAVGRKVQYAIFCRTKDNNLHRIDVNSEMEQNMVLACLQSAQQAAGAGR